MKEHLVNQLNNFICGWYIDIPTCDNLVELFKKNENKFEGRFSDTQKGLTVDKTMKDSIECLLEGDDLLCKKYNEELQKCVDLYRKKYEFCDATTQWTILTNPNIQYYAPKGGYYVWHNERACRAEPFVSRHLVFMTYLNDVTDAGETEFYYQKLKIKPEKGLTVIWPVDWTFTHRGVSSPSQEKYIVTGWFNFIS